MKMQIATWALSGLLAGGMTCGMAFAQSQGSGTMNTNAQGTAATNSQSTMGTGQQNSMGQGTMNQGSMQAGTGTMQEQGNMGRHHGGMDVDQRLAHMTKKYNLTSDQQSQIRPILQDEQQQMMTMHSDSSMSRQDRMTKMQSMHQDQNQKIEAILNDTQKKQFEADQQKMEQKHMNRMKNGGMNGGMNSNGSMSGNGNGNTSGNGTMANCHPQ